MNEILTIGYGAKEIEDFLDSLLQSGVAYLIDIRSSPYSSRRPEFSRDALEAVLRKAQIRYVFMGDQIGGKPQNRDCYDESGKASYDKIAEMDEFQAGIQRLIKASRNGDRVCLMCSEGKPEKCHRSKLIGVELQKKDVNVIHIDERGILRSQEEVINRINKFQPQFFEQSFTSRRSYAT